MSNEPATSRDPRIDPLVTDCLETKLHVFYITKVEDGLVSYEWNTHGNDRRLRHHKRKQNRITLALWRQIHTERIRDEQ